MLPENVSPKPGWKSAELANHIKTLLAFESLKEVFDGKLNREFAWLTYSQVRDRVDTTRRVNHMTLLRTLKFLQEKGDIEKVKDTESSRYRLRENVSPDRIPELARGLVEEAIRGAIPIGMDSRLSTSNWAIYGVPREPLSRFRRVTHKSLTRLQEAIDRHLDSEIESICKWLKAQSELWRERAELRNARDSLMELVNLNRDVRFLFETATVGWRSAGLEMGQIPEGPIRQASELIAQRVKAEPNPPSNPAEPLNRVLRKLNPQNQKRASVRIGGLLATARWATVVVR